MPHLPPSSAPPRLPIEVRPGGADDAPFLKEMDRLATDASPTLLAQIHRPAWDAHVDAFWAAFPEGGGTAYVAWEGNLRVGGITLTRHAPGTQGVEALRLGMAVVGEARRQGVGRALLDAAVRHTREAGYPYLALYVDPRNEPARRLYRAYGFRDHRREAGLWEMRLPLS